MRVRAPRRDEAEAVLAVIVARDVADIGRPDYTMDDLLLDWSLPGLDLERDVFVVQDDDGTLIGWADVDERAARVSVHPDHEGRGAATLLREAVEARMRERGHRMCQNVVSANTSALAHLRAAGYEPVQYYQRMRGAHADVPSAPEVPVRRFDLDADGAAVHELIKDAFSEIEHNAPQSFESWRAEVAEGSEPAFRQALDDEQGLAGAAVGERWEDGVGYVARLAVARRARGRGHDRALLLALLNAFGDAGLSTAELSVAGTNAQATGLYEPAGMAPDFRA